MWPDFGSKTADGAEGVQARLELDRALGVDREDRRRDDVAAPRDAVGAGRAVLCALRVLGGLRVLRGLRVPRDLRAAGPRVPGPLTVARGRLRGAGLRAAPEPRGSMPPKNPAKSDAASLSNQRTRVRAFTE
jgi:hypothetical protein